MHFLNSGGFFLFCFVFQQFLIIIIIIIINPLTLRVDVAPQMILQPVFSIFPCSQLPSGTCRTPGLSIPWCCLPASSSVCLVFSLSLCLARWFWPDLRNRETWPYHCNLRLFTIVRRSSCGPIACWVLARTSSLVTWSLSEMCGMLLPQETTFPMQLYKVDVAPILYPYVFPLWFLFPAVTLKIIWCCYHCDYWFYDNTLYNIAT